MNVADHVLARRDVFLHLTQEDDSVRRMWVGIVHVMHGFARDVRDQVAYVHSVQVPPAAGRDAVLGSGAPGRIPAEARLGSARLGSSILRTVLEPPGPTLSTDRLVLRRWLERDRAPFAEMNADPEVMGYFTRPLARPESDSMVERIEARFEEHGYGLWAVEHREGGAFLGFTGLATTASLGFVGPAAALLGPPPIPEAEIGWRFARSAWGHGYATEAARAVLRFGFESARMHEIVSLTSTLNLPSMRVMERIGLHRDPADDFDHPRIPEGSAIRRHVLYRLTRPEYLRLPRL